MTTATLQEAPSGPLTFIGSTEPDFSGNDSLYGGKKGGTLDGGAGYDTLALFDGYGNYRFATDAATGDLVVTRVTSGIGTAPGVQTRVSNVEALSIDGVTVPLQGWALEPEALRGTAGEDTAQVAGNYGDTQLQLSADGREVTVTVGRAAPVTLRDVEVLQFADLRIRVADELQQVPSQHRSSDDGDALVGNDRGYALHGGNGNDHFTGNGGDDALYGGKGQDTAAYRGPRSDYRVEFDIKTGAITVTDTVPGRDGQDTLQGIELLRFADVDLQALDVAAPVLATLPDGGQRVLGGGWDSLAINLKWAQEPPAPAGEAGGILLIGFDTASTTLGGTEQAPGTSSLAATWAEPALIGTAQTGHDWLDLLP